MLPTSPVRRDRSEVVERWRGIAKRTGRAVVSTAVGAIVTITISIIIVNAVVVIKAVWLPNSVRGPKGSGV